MLTENYKIINDDTTFIYIKLSFGMKKKSYKFLFFLSCKMCFFNSIFVHLNKVIMDNLN